MSDGTDIGPSLIEYARFHGLADNHLNQDILRRLPSDLTPCSDDAGLPEFQVPCVGTLPSEPKFQLDSKAASLLASSIKPPPAPSWSNILSDHHQVKNLKLEQPALKTDHGSDMGKICFRKLPKAEALCLVPFEIGEEESECLAWPPWLVDLAVQWDRRAAKEKLQTTREVLKALQDNLRPVYTTDTHEAIVTEELAFTKV
jgi:hypothetical protein